MVVTLEAELEVVRALTVPDPEHWTMCGVDVVSLGYVPADGPEHAQVLLVPDRIPEALRGALLDAWSRLPEPRRFRLLESDLAGVPAGTVLGEARASASSHGTADEERHGEHGHDGHGEAADQHDHHDMMAIVGDPSGDGLVMEPIDFVLGPLFPTFPGGLVAKISLDGDVVDHCALEATLTLRDSGDSEVAAGPGSTAALGAAVSAARERTAGVSASESVERLRVAAIELERGLGHAAWLRSFGRTLGWSELAQRAQAAVNLLLEPRRVAAALAAAVSEGPPRDEEWCEALPGIRRAVQAAVRLTDGRRLGARASGRALTPASEVSSAPVGGPVARAAGLRRDARLGDPLYEHLGFEIERDDAADAAARARVRAREMSGAVALAAAAVMEAGSSAAGSEARPADPVAVEGRRGPLLATITGDSTPSVTAQGAADVLRLAGDSVRGLELASALSGIASFDPSPWRVGR